MEDGGRVSGTRPASAAGVRWGLSAAPFAGGPAEGQQKGLAITSFVLGLLSLVCFGLLAGIPAIICGHVARGRARRVPAQYGGAGFALAGLIMGYVSVLVTLVILPAMLLPALTRPKARPKGSVAVNNMKQIGLSFRSGRLINNDNFPFNVSTNKGGTLELCLPGSDGFDRNSAFHFQVMSNELGSAEDSGLSGRYQEAAGAQFRKPPAGECELPGCSGANVTEVNPEQVLAVCPIHNNVLLCDGSVVREKDVKLSPIGRFLQIRSHRLIKEVLQDAELPTAQAEKSQCQLDLTKMFAAVKAYQKVHGDTPDWLSDLVPTYLADTNILVCPAARRTSVTTYPGLEDPRIPTSYTYDFCARQVPITVWGGAPVTMKDWKNRQRKIYGDAVPMIRCTHHDRVLNISYGGELFESSVTWESDDRFCNSVRGSKNGRCSNNGRGLNHPTAGLGHAFLCMANYSSRSNSTRVASNTSGCARKQLSSLSFDAGLRPRRAKGKCFCPCAFWILIGWNELHDPFRLLLGDPGGVAGCGWCHPGAGRSLSACSLC